MDATMNDYDVIIVGGGGSGLAAAYTVAELGGSVLVLEKQPFLGGTTGMAVGTFTGNRTSMQRQAGIIDDVAHHAEDASKFAPADIELRNNNALREFFLGQTADTFEWLRSLGLSFYGPNPEPPNRVPRMHNVVPGAKAYIAALQSGVLRLGGTILCGQSVVGLLREQDRIAGVRVEVLGQVVEYRARRGVILAAGDYASAADLLRQYKGERFQAIEGINPHSTGDGHRLVAETGGVLLNMDVTYGPELRFVPPARKPFQQLLPAGRLSGRIMGGLFRMMPAAIKAALIKRLLVTWQHPENKLFDDGAILLNSRGERFCNERVFPNREIAVAEQPDKICYILLDARLVERYSTWPHFISTAPKIAYAYAKDYLRLRPDVAVRCESLAELAKRRSFDPVLLQRSVTDFNRYVKSEQQDPFGRQGDTHPLETGPWLLLGPAKAYFTTTEGGAAINNQLQVLDGDRRPIPGLYAVGQNGLGGMVLWGHGLHIAWAMTSGRLAGKEVMKGEQ